jgi:hypothetical protein
MQMLIHEGLGDEDLMMREAISMQMLIHEGLGDEDLMMREAIVMHSACTQHGNQRGPRRSNAIRSDQRSSVVISGHQRPSAAISGIQQTLQSCSAA